MDLITIIIFCAILLTCVIIKISIVYAMLAGLILFLIYGKKKGFKWKELYKMSLSGVKKTEGMLFIFLLIGMLTALWRGSGTIPAIIYYSSNLIHPSSFILITFILNAIVSILTGTSFGTAATMGVICMTIANTMEINQVWIGGAIVSGIFFGDRCSPVSTSALLVSTLTETNLFNNIKNMIYTSMIPFIITCAIYLFAGIFYVGGTNDVAGLDLFSKSFVINPLCLLPALTILILSFCRVNVKWTMLISIFISFIIALVVQKTNIYEIISMMFIGYNTSFSDLAPMIDGGGVISMIKVAIIVCIASCYSGIFEETNILKFAKNIIENLSKKISPYGATLVTSMFTGAISCNQTLAIMLTHQLCVDLEDNEKCAINLEDSAVITSPLIPWSIAGAVPLATIGAPMISLIAASFLYVLPICRLVAALFFKSRFKTTEKE